MALLEDLPDEILVNTFSFMVGDSATLLNLCLTSKRIHPVAEEVLYQVYRNWCPGPGPYRGDDSLSWWCKTSIPFFSRRPDLALRVREASLGPWSEFLALSTYDDPLYRAFTAPTSLEVLGTLRRLRCLAKLNLAIHSRPGKIVLEDIATTHPALKDVDITFRRVDGVPEEANHLLLDFIFPLLKHQSLKSLTLRNIDFLASDSFQQWHTKYKPLSAIQDFSWLQCSSGSTEKLDDIMKVFDSLKTFVYEQHEDDRKSHRFARRNIAHLINSIAHQHTSLQQLRIALVDIGECTCRPLSIPTGMPFQSFHQLTYLDIDAILLQYIDDDGQSRVGMNPFSPASLANFLPPCLRRLRISKCAYQNCAVLVPLHYLSKVDSSRFLDLERVLMNAGSERAVFWAAVEKLDWRKGPGSVAEFTLFRVEK